MSFLNDFEQILSVECRQNEPPFCTAECPFRLDVKDLMKKIQKGRFNAAFRTFQNTVGFPGIVAAACPHPCEKACLRAEKDGSLHLHQLEQAMLSYATRKKPNAYNMPGKGKKIAVIGGGISGLACTLSLCHKKYDVTVFEKSGRIGGHLWDVLSPEIFLSDIEEQFQFESYTLESGREILALTEVSEFDAVYVATGKGGADFGLSLSGSGAYASGQNGVFLGGSLMGADTMQAIADGLEASHAMEWYLKTGGMNQPAAPKGTGLRLDSSRLTEMPEVIPADGERYSEEEAAKEAGRCALCSCDACMRECDLMRLFEKTPRRIYEEVYITIHPGTLSRDGTWATRLISTCNQCGLCKSVCPQKIDIGKFFRQSHQAMVKKGAMPWAFHDYFLRDMEFSNGEAALLKKATRTDGTPSYVFFPGCQMGASDPDYVKESYRYLLSKQPDTALWLRCCGAPADWGGEEERHEAEIREIRKQWEEMGKPEVVFGCPTCRQMFAKYLPEISGEFLYEKMAEWGIDLPKPETETCSIFDPCASRDFPELQQSVRKLTEGMGIPLTPLSHEGELAQCCSYGGHTSVAASLYSREVARERLAEKENPYIAYCVNCRDTFASQSKPVYHLLDLVFGLNGSGRIPPTLTERWENRRELKRSLLMEYWNEETEKRKKMNLWISEELKRKLSRDMILESDMAEVISWCEETGRRLKDPETGHLVGHKKIQNMTFWAEYLPKEDGFELFGGYAHRMCLEDDVKCQSEK